MRSDWIARLAEDERKRDEVHLRETEAAARQADFVRVQGEQLLDELRSTVVRDIQMFRAEFPDDKAREVLMEAIPDGGFVVRKPQSPTAALSVLLHLSAASVKCEYRFTPINGLPPREDRVDFMLRSNNNDTLQIKHHGNGQVFTNADALSEYLLAPVFTGRPR